MMRPPRIGDTVIYRNGSAEFMGANNGGQDAPAVIVRAWGPDMANLRVLCDGNQTLWKPSVARDESGKSEYGSFRSADTMLP